jgi:glycogen debranching enzyme
MAAAARSSFNQLFWNEKDGCLFDVLNGSAADPAIRPNQIFALSLTHSMLPTDRAKSVLAKVQEHLLTPYGLRSLAPSDPKYRGRYSGGPVERDGAYHQGTVWAWLMGPFITAYVKVNGRNAASRLQAAEWLKPLQDHLSDDGLGHISEIFDGDSPHRPSGCIAQAWSVGQVLRAYVADIHEIKPIVAGDPVPAKSQVSLP